VVGADSPCHIAAAAGVNLFTPRLGGAP
jgi:hypothetical protein